jgi:hypothetical protein
MNLTRNLTAVVLVSCGVISTSLPSLADTETTTVRRTTFFGNGQELVLPPTSTYVLFDPNTGIVNGKFDPTRGFTDLQTVQPGLIVIDQPTGKIIATVDPAGKTIDVASVPAINSLVVAIYTRRCDLERMITDFLAKGIIDTTQASRLRAETDKIAADEFTAKQNGGILTYAEALSLAVSLNTIGDQLVSYTHTAPVEPLLGSRFAVVDGQIVMINRGAQ